jgi:hypothetical protein
MSAPAAAAPLGVSDGRADFEFIMGSWRVHHRRLKTRLAGDTRWEEFGGTSVVWPLLGGLGTVDDNVIELPAGTYRAATVRVFDPRTRLWSIWWIDGRYPGIDTPVHGRFDGGVGTFLGNDVFDGRPIRVRFIWSDIGPSSARWEQAFSTDGGTEWETNWVMRFERTG